jgi:hypothetical protein
MLTYRVRKGQMNIVKMHTFASRLFFKDVDLT